MNNEMDQELKVQIDCKPDEKILSRLEDAYKVYRMSEVFLNDVCDDYGKQKIARLRLDFARHELLSLMKEAREKGVKWESSDMIKRYFYKNQ